MTLRPLERKVYINDEAFPVTPTEYSFLNCLIQQKEAAVSKTKLLEQVWGYGYRLTQKQETQENLVK